MFLYIRFRDNETKDIEIEFNDTITINDEIRAFKHKEDMLNELYSLISISKKDFIIITKQDKSYIINLKNIIYITDTRF